MKNTKLTVDGKSVTGEPVEQNEPQAQSQPEDDINKPLEERIQDAIKEVYDPEIPVNIHELGLIYDVELDQSTGDVKVIMTLTSPACPAAQELPLEVRRNIGKLQGVNEVDVEITFEPPWGPERMSDVAKLQLGML